MFFCNTEQDCKFAYYEAITPMECEKKLGDMMAIAKSQRVPLHFGSCIVIKGNKV